MPNGEHRKLMLLNAVDLRRRRTRSPSPAPGRAATRRDSSTQPLKNLRDGLRVLHLLAISELLFCDLHFLQQPDLLDKALVLTDIEQNRRTSAVLRQHEGPACRADSLRGSWR